MPSFKPALVGLVVCCCFFVPALACIWDSDTLEMERQRFPTVLEIISGKFLRHSNEFYQWRIKDRSAKLSANSEKLEYYDDLAVAFSKIGQHAKAIETILKKNKIKPDVYETYSNLGTFQFFNGQIEESIPTIEKALKINPDAHFGREIYQKLLFEYMLSVRKDGMIPSTLNPSPRYSEGYPQGFADFIMKHRGPSDTGKALESDAETRKALKGVLGMMTFANHEAPILLEALGDLLLINIQDSRTSYQENGDAKMLAARAYLKASYVSTEEAAKKAYRTMAQSALAMQVSHVAGQHEMTLDLLESQFRQEQAEADRWYAKVRASELDWISKGEDPEANFSKTYYKNPEIGVETRLENSETINPATPAAIQNPKPTVAPPSSRTSGLVLVALCLLASTFVSVYLARKASQRSATRSPRRANSREKVSGGTASS
ncbi:MAG: tetratricopeptide repeat protein [Planctomycetes bacterium]|nr:tetratricopeptide repeat protein [Planctomycetota bacterium]